MFFIEFYFFFRWVSFFGSIYLKRFSRDSAAIRHFLWRELVFIIFLFIVYFFPIPQRASNMVRILMRMRIRILLFLILVVVSHQNWRFVIIFIHFFRILPFDIRLRLNLFLLLLFHHHYCLIIFWRFHFLFNVLVCFDILRTFRLVLRLLSWGWGNIRFRNSFLLLFLWSSFISFIFFDRFRFRIWLLWWRDIFFTRVFFWLFFGNFFLFDLLFVNFWLWRWLDFSFCLFFVVPSFSFFLRIEVRIFFWCFFFWCLNGLFDSPRNHFWLLLVMILSFGTFRWFYFSLHEVNSQAY